MDAQGALTHSLGRDTGPRSPSGEPTAHVPLDQDGQELTDPRRAEPGAGKRQVPTHVLLRGTVPAHLHQQPRLQPAELLLDGLNASQGETGASDAVVTPPPVGANGTAPPTDASAPAPPWSTGRTCTDVSPVHGCGIPVAGRRTALGAPGRAVAARGAAGAIDSDPDSRMLAASASSRGTDPSAMDGSARSRTDAESFDGRASRLPHRVLNEPPDTAAVATGWPAWRHPDVATPARATPSPSRGTKADRPVVAFAPTPRAGPDAGPVDNRSGRVPTGLPPGSRPGSHLSRVSRVGASRAMLAAGSSVEQSREPGPHAVVPRLHRASTGATRLSGGPT